MRPCWVRSATGSSRSARRTVGFGKPTPSFGSICARAWPRLPPIAGSHVGLRVRTANWSTPSMRPRSPPAAPRWRAGLRPQHGELLRRLHPRSDGNRVEAVTFLRPMGDLSRKNIDAGACPDLGDDARRRLCPPPPPRQGAPKIVVGDNPSLSGAPLYVALEKGYYREAGLDVQMEMSGTSSDMAVLLETNRLQVIGGALSAGFFISLEGPPDRPPHGAGDQPLRPLPDDPSRSDSEAREPADLKGRTVAVAARGAILVYELVEDPRSRRPFARRYRIEIHSVRPDGDRAHDRRGRRCADDLAAAGSRSRPRGSG